MAQYSAAWSQITAAAVNDTTTFTAGQAPGFLRSGGATQQLKIREVNIGGLDSTATATEMILARTSTISVGALTVGTLAATDFLTTAPGTLPSWGSTAAMMFPQRSSTLYLLQLPLNTSGGIMRWQARFGEELTVYGNTATGRAVSIVQAGGGQDVGAHSVRGSVMRELKG